MSKFREIVKDNRADSNIVSALVLIPLFLVIFMSIIDISFFMSTRSQLQDFAADGARIVSIYGGNGNAQMATPIESFYGKRRSVVCGNINKNSPFLADNIRNNQSNMSGVECTIVKNISESIGMVNAKVDGVSCSPEMSTSLNDTAKCVISFKYTSLPGSVFGLLQYWKAQDGTKLYQGKYDPLGMNVVFGTAQTEVDLSGQQLQYRVK